MPADDPVFRRTNLAQWLWYGAQIAKDEEENFELLRDVAEHNAMFWNSEGVDQVRKSREQTFKMDDKSFGSMIEQTFGRKVNLPDNPNANRAKLETPKEDRQSVVPRRRMRSDVDAESYLDMDLDEIKFVPFQTQE